MGDRNIARVTGGDVNIQSVMKSVNCDVKLGLNSSSYNRHQFLQASAGGVMGASGKVLFTANQWEELERQKKIYMYIMASVPVPPQLLSPLSVQSRVSTGLRFSTGSDPEPWRCRRTDGKKWRCSKDVAPDQKYCERHVHKTRSRSRKPVETQSQNLMNPATNQQTRFMKNGTIPMSQSNTNQFQLPLQSPSVGSTNDRISKKNSKGDNQQSSCLDRNNYYVNTSGIDRSRIGGGDECSLTLSMQSGANEVEFDDESFQMAVGMLRGDRDVFKPNHQWVNQGSWVGSGVTPGGPLGEALCLGIANNQNDPYSQGYSYSTTTSGSCEGGGDSHGLDYDLVNPRDD